MHFSYFTIFAFKGGPKYGWNEIDDLLASTYYWQMRRYFSLFFPFYDGNNGKWGNGQMTMVANLSPLKYLTSTPMFSSVNAMVVGKYITHLFSACAVDLIIQGSSIFLVPWTQRGTQPNSRHRVQLHFCSAQVSTLNLINQNEKKNYESYMEYGYYTNAWLP